MRARRDRSKAALRAARARRDAQYRAIASVPGLVRSLWSPPVRPSASISSAASASIPSAAPTSRDVTKTLLALTKGPKQYSEALLKLGVLADKVPPLISASAEELRRVYSNDAVSRVFEAVGTTGNVLGWLQDLTKATQAALEASRADKADWADVKTFVVHLILLRQYKGNTNKLLRHVILKCVSLARGNAHPIGLALDVAMALHALARLAPATRGYADSIDVLGWVKQHLLERQYRSTLDAGALEACARVRGVLVQLEHELKSLPLLRVDGPLDEHLLMQVLIEGDLVASIDRCVAGPHVARNPSLAAVVVDSTVFDRPWGTKESEWVAQRLASLYIG